MRVIVVLAVLGLASGPAWAQGGDRELNRLKERLGLTDEQVEKIRELNKNQREGEDKLQKERDEKFKEVLTEEQRTKYEEYRRNPRGGGGGGGGFGGGGGQGWMERFQAPPIDLLKKDVGINDEQAEKIKPHLDHFNEVGRKNFEEMQQNGFQGFNWQDETKKFQDRVKEMGEKVKEHLSDEQKEKYDKLSQSRYTVGGFGGFGGGGGGGNPRREERGPQRPSVDDRVRRVMEAFKMENAEEAAVVRDLVKRVVEAQYALEDYEKTAKTSLDELSKKAEATEDEIKTKIDELRGGRKEKDKAVKDAQKALAEIVTYRQELELIKAGILR